MSKLRAAGQYRPPYTFIQPTNVINKCFEKLNKKLSRGFIEVFVSTYLCAKKEKKKEICYVHIYRTFLSDVPLKSVLTTINIKLESQLDKILLEKHQYHCCHQDTCMGLIMKGFYRY
jgi:hypothetical protein